MNFLDHNDCLRRCHELRKQHPAVFEAYDKMRREGGFYPPKGTAQRKIIDEYERLSARAARYTGNF